MKKLKLRDFVKLCNDSHVSSFLFSTQNQKDSNEYSFDFTLEFDHIEAIANQNVVKFSTINKTCLLLNSVLEIHIKDEIPGLGTPFTVYCASSSLESAEPEEYVFVMR